MDVFTCPPLDGRAICGRVLVDRDGMIEHVGVCNHRREGENPSTVGHEGGGVEGEVRIPAVGSFGILV